MLNRFPLLRIAIFLIFGIILGLNFPVSKLIPQVALFVFLIPIYILLRFYKKKYFSLAHIIGGLILILFVTLGFSLSNNHNQFINDEHFRKGQAIQSYVAKVSSYPQTKSKYTRVTVNLVLAREHTQWIEHSGLIQLIIADSIGLVKYGDILLAPSIYQSTA